MDEQFHSSLYSVSNKDSEFVMYKNYSKEDRTNLKLFKEEIERKTDDFELVFPWTDYPYYQKFFENPRPGNKTLYDYLFKIRMHKKTYLAHS